MFKQLYVLFRCKNKSKEWSFNALYFLLPEETRKRIWHARFVILFWRLPLWLSYVFVKFDPSSLAKCDSYDNNRNHLAFYLLWGLPLLTGDSITADSQLHSGTSDELTDDSRQLSSKRIFSFHNRARDTWLTGSWISVHNLSFSRSQFIFGRPFYLSSEDILYVIVSTLEVCVKGAESIITCILLSPNFPS